MTAIEIVETGTPYIVSRAVWIDAPPEQIFDLLADPRRHADFDGSGSVTGYASGPERLSLGAKFGMGMRIVVP
ncbi:MAG: polyketide cyclase / dehydrase and lipid transport, partial [Candidatus Nanopelagicales bacterium]